MSRRWLVVSLGSPLLAAAPAGVLEAAWTRSGAWRACWFDKSLSGFMEFGVVDRRSGLVVRTTDGSHKGRSEDERRVLRGSR